MKGVGEVGQPVFGLVEIDEFGRPTFSGCPGQTGAQHPVVGSDEILVPDPPGNGPAISTDPWVDHDHVNGPRREEKHIAVDDEVRFADVLGSDLVGEVGDYRGGCDSVDDTVEHGLAALPVAEVG